MILVDTSVWIDHLRKTDQKLFEILQNGKVCIHPFIVGEIACGNLTNRVEIIDLLKALPEVLMVSHDEILQFIENRELYGKGLGYIDIHLLASSFINKVPLWTRDKRLSAVSSELKLNEK